MPPARQAPWVLGLAVRVCNFIVTVLGCGLVAYGVYLIVAPNAGGFSALSGAALALGAIDATMGLALTCCGHNSLFFLRLYALVVGLLELGQVSAAVLFILPETQDRIINAIDPPANVRSWLASNISTTGFVLLGVVAFQAVTLLLVFAQACVVDRGFDEDAVADNESLLSSSSSAGASYLSSFGYAARGKSRNAAAGADRFGALADEEHAAPSAADRYRSKAEKYYSKYGLR